MISAADEFKIKEMVNMLRHLKQNSCIILISSNDEHLRQEVEKRLSGHLEEDGFSLRKITLTRNSNKNLPLMLREMNPRANEIFFIYGFKQTLPEDFLESKAWPASFQYLNYRREDFVEKNISVVFWLDKPTLTGIGQRAPDFWAFQTMVCEFERREKEIAVGDSLLDFESYGYKILEELNEEINFKKETLADYEATMPEDVVTRANLCLEIGVRFHHKNEYEAAKAYYQKGLELFREGKDKKGEATCLGQFGAIERVRGNLDIALEYHRKALDIDEKIGYSQDMVMELQWIGRIYAAKGEVEKADEYYRQALKIARDTGFLRGEGRVLSYMGVISLIKGELEEALEYSQKALSIFRRVGYRQGEVNSLSLLGVAWGKKEDWKRALKYLQEGLELAESIRYPLGATSILRDIGRIYQHQGDLDQALKYYEKALQTARKIGYLQGQAEILSSLALVYMRKGNDSEAVANKKEALVIFEKMGSKIPADLSDIPPG